MVTRLCVASTVELPTDVAGLDKIEVTVLMPCLNEAKTLGACIAEAQRALCASRIRGEIVIADNGSTDGSAEIAKQLQARVVALDKRGYGSALAAGIAAARGQHVIMGDADQSYDFSHLPRFIEKLREGYDLVMGNRFQGGILPGAMPALHRYLGNPVLSGLGRLFFRAPVGDFHCGLRAFRKEAIQGLDLKTTGMEFASEMVVKAVIHGLRIAEVPTVLRPDGRERAPHLRSWRDGWRHLRFMLLYSPRWLFLYPGLCLMLVGLLVVAWLFPGPRRVGGVTFDVHTMLYAMAAVLVGFQAVLFAVLSKVFAMTTGLVPETPAWRRAFRWMTLETGLSVGAALFFGGLVCSCLALRIWGSQSFGPLDPVQTLRLVIPSAGAIAIGCEIILASFFLSMLGLARK